VEFSYSHGDRRHHPNIDSFQQFLPIPNLHPPIPPHPSPPVCAPVSSSIFSSPCDILSRKRRLPTSQTRKPELRLPAAKTILKRAMMKVSIRMPKLVCEQLKPQRPYVTMAPYEETKGVLKLTANNYSEWARRMRAVFRARKLWKFLFPHDLAKTLSTTRSTARTTENQAPEDLPGPATPAAVMPTLPTPSYDQNIEIAELIDATLSTDIR